MKSINVAFYKEGDHWVAQALNVEVSTFADTWDGAKAAMREALELYFEGEEHEVTDIEAVTVEGIDVRVA